MNAKEVYTYTCAQHSLGAFVREVDSDEQRALASVYAIDRRRSHYMNCWVKGCQMALTQVRLVRTTEPSSSNRTEEKP